MMTIPIPQRMQQLPLDPRGYPIPAIVFRDSQGRPHFTINDTAARLRLAVADRCGICGTRLIGGRWFVGGPRSAFDPHGAYNDGPLHFECMRYAMQVCPYLAAPRYTRNINAATLGEEQILTDITMLPDRPYIFVCVMVLEQTIQRSERNQFVFVPYQPYQRIEYWQHSKQIDEAIAKPIIEAVLNMPIPQLQPTRVYLHKPNKR